MINNNRNIIKLVRKGVFFKFCNFSSALYITGDKAQSNFIALTPYIDFDNQIETKKELLIKSIKARDIKLDLDQIIKRWNFYKTINEQKIILETTRDEILSRIKILKEDSDKNKSEIDKLILHSKIVKDDLKNVRDYSYGIEENAMLGVLNLPNFLHPNTPLSSIHILHQYKNLENHKSSKNHVEIGESYNLLQFHSPMFYYLKSEAALFEYAITNYFQQNLIEKHLIQFSNADFARSLVVEGCGTDYLDSKQVFTIFEPQNQEISKLHLVGGGSLYSFMAYFARHLLAETNLPLKLFSIGRNYTPITNNNTNLFHTAQQTIVRVFLVTPDNDLVENEVFDWIKNEIIQIYEALGYHFRLVYLPANDLAKSESLHLSIQMFSSYSQSYVEVGNLGVYDNYLSKRLLFTYKDGNERKFPRIISGEVLNVQKLLACILETSKEPKLLSDLLLEHV